MSEETAGKLSGAELIAAERWRQVETEGYGAQYDDHHTKGELARAAMVYADPYRGDTLHPPQFWPWRDEFYKPKDRISNLVRAGALIAAEIDRLQRER